jgi:hypothetical protein
MCSARRVSTTTDSLPNDIESLRALAAQAITERDVAIAEREAAMKERDAERAEKAKLVAERDRLQSLYACLLGGLCRGGTGTALRAAEGALSIGTEDCPRTGVQACPLRDVD